MKLTRLLALFEETYSWLLPSYFSIKYECYPQNIFPGLLAVAAYLYGLEKNEILSVYFFLYHGLGRKTP